VCAQVVARAHMDNAAALLPYIGDDVHWLAQMSQWLVDGQVALVPDNKYARACRSLE
jgi:acetyl-CoA acetyltransferase